MPTETRSIRPSGERASVSRSPLLSRNTILVLSCFIIFMAINSIFQFLPNPDEPRVNFGLIGYTLGTGFGSLLFFWILCKGVEIARRIEFREQLVLIVMTVLGLVLYVAFFVYVAQHSGSLMFIVVVLIPLLPTFYFGIGFIIGLLSRMVASDREHAP